MLRIAGITPFSTVDWPGKLVCVAFLAGCPWRCPYCQNAALQDAGAATRTDKDLFAFLERRRGMLDGVVLSGGEPLAQAESVDAARKAHELGFAVGIHTCGAYPDRLRAALPYLDWVGLDIKAPWDVYDRITRRTATAELVQQSLGAVLASNVELETRTTWHPDLLDPEEIRSIAHDLAGRRVRTWAVQAYRPAGTTKELADITVYPRDVPSELSQLFEHYEFRRA